MYNIDTKCSMLYNFFLRYLSSRQISEYLSLISIYSLVYCLVVRLGTNALAYLPGASVTKVQHWHQMFNVIKLFSSLLKLPANKRVFVLDKPLQSSLLFGSEAKDKCSSLFAWSISNKGITLTPNVQCYKTFFFVTVALVNKLECLSLKSLYNLV
jgi:hypothetical protein